MYNMNINTNMNYKYTLCRVILFHIESHSYNNNDMYTNMYIV